MTRKENGVVGFRDTMDLEEGNLIVLQKKTSVDSTGLLKSKLQHLKVSAFAVIVSHRIHNLKKSVPLFSFLTSRLRVAGRIQEVETTVTVSVDKA